VAESKCRVATSIIFSYGVIAHRKILIFANLVTFYMHNQDPLLVDFCLLQATCFALLFNYIS